MSATYYFHAAAGGARRVSRVFSRAAYGRIAGLFVSPYAEQNAALREVQALLDPLLQAEDTLDATAVFSGFKSRLSRDGHYILQLDRKRSLDITYRDAQYCVTGLGEDPLFFASANEVAEALTPALRAAIEKHGAQLMKRAKPIVIGAPTLAACVAAAAIGYAIYASSEGPTPEKPAIGMAYERR